MPDLWLSIPSWNRSRLLWNHHDRRPPGGWVNPENPDESLHPDLDNAGDGPHWDWNGPGGQRYRIYPDGTVAPKK
jgi:hypothetical protein